MRLMFTVDDARCINQLETANKQRSKFVAENVLLFYIVKTPWSWCVQSLIAQYVKICQLQCIQHVQALDKCFK